MPDLWYGSEKPWKRKVKRFFSNVVALILSLMVPALEALALWLFSVAFKFDMSFGQYVAGVLGMSLVIGIAAGVNSAVANRR